LDEAIACFRKAIELDPKLAGVQGNLGVALLNKGQADEAIAVFRTAIKLQPESGGLYSNFGRILGYLGRHDEAIEACRKAIKLNPNDGGAHYNLGNSLAAQGQLRDALAAFSEAQRLDRSLSESRQWQLLYHAARAAARAAAGKGKDEPPPDDAAKVKLRQQALDWLMAELAEWAKVLQSQGPRARPFVAQMVQRWMVEPDLAGIRDRDVRAKLPAEEQKAWEALWKDVDALLKGEAISQPTRSEPCGSPAARPGEAPAGSKPSTPKLARPSSEPRP
jgi:tetratricopeptide (TPR) repeat protein